MLSRCFDTWRTGCRTGAGQAGNENGQLRNLVDTGPWSARCFDTWRTPGVVVEVWAIAGMSERVIITGGATAVNQVKGAFAGGEPHN